MSDTRHPTSAERAPKPPETSEGLYLNLFQRHHAVMLVIDPATGAIVNANEAACAFYGYPHEAVTRLNIAEINTLSAEDVHAHMQTARTEANGPFNFRHRLADGSMRDVEVFSGPIAHQGRELLVSIVHDVTEQKRAQQALAESESFHRQTLESIPGMVFITRPDGFCDYQSRQWEHYTGVPVSEHLGDGWNRLLHPDDQPRAMAAWREAVAGRAPYDLEYRVRKHDGRYEWFRVIGRPIQDDQGRIVRWFGVAMNIERLKRAEAALRLSEEKFRSAFAEARIGFALRNPDGFLVDANPAYCTLTGYTLEELRSFHFDKLIYPEDLAENQRLVEEMLAGAFASFVVENRYLRKNGAPVWVRKSVSLVRDDKGRPQWFNTLVEDITERKQEEEARHQINEELTEYAYALTHNLKAPLRAVQNYTNFLFEDLADTLQGEPKKYLEGIRIAVRQGHHQIEDLETLYRIKDHEVSIEPFDLQEIFDEMRSIYEDRPDRQLIVARGCPELRGERFLLRQILIELIRNGFKFNQSELKRVKVGCRPAKFGSGIEICVQDNGIGIAPRYHAQIFRIFQRLHTASEYKGTGIGLAIVKRAVQKMGGTLRLESDTGKGCRFCIHLPEAMVPGI